MSPEERRLWVSHQRNYDWSFPWHLEEAHREENRWVTRLVSRHRTREAANKAMAKRQRQIDRAA